MDIVNVHCSACGGLIGLRRSDLGHRVRCPRCQAVIVAAEDTAPGEPPQKSTDVLGTIATTPVGQDVAAPAPNQFSDQPGFSGFGHQPAAPGPAEEESIFGPPEGASDDLFGEAYRPGVSIPPVEDLNPPGAHAVAPDLPPAEMDQHYDSPQHHPFVAAGPAERPSALEDHPDDRPTARVGETVPPAESSTSAPARHPVEVKRRSAPSALVPILLIALIPYAIFATGVIAYLLYQQYGLSRDPTIRYLEKMLEEKGKNSREVRRVQHDAPLPENLRVPLHSQLQIGAIEVRPMKVVLNAQGDLVLHLHIKNVSSEDNGGRLEFDPLPARFTEYDPKKKDAPKPYTFLDNGAGRLYGGHVQWLRGQAGAERPTDDATLAPGEEETALLVTPTRDRLQVAQLLNAQRPLLWRVQLRRGLEKLRGDDWAITCVVGVEFKGGDVERATP